MPAKTPPLACVICAVLIFVPVFASAQTENQKPVSLADLARQQRAKNNKDDKQKAKVYSNEDLPEHPPDAKSADSAELNSNTGKEAEKANGDTDTKTDTSGSEPHDEKYFRGKMNELRKNLESDKKRLAAARQAIDEHEKDLPPNTVLRKQSDSDAPIENNPMIKYQTVVDRTVVDPPHAPPAVEASQLFGVKKDNNNWTKDTWEAEEQRLADNIGSLEEKIATDEEKISALVVQCRRENCQPGWIR